MCFIKRQEKSVADDTSSGSGSSIALVPSARKFSGTGNKWYDPYIPC